MPDYTGGQFPSLDGDLEAEVAQRTEPDTDGSWFRHVFTVHNRAHTTGLPDDHEVHRANFVAVIQRALQQGLHPKAQPELESEEPCPSDPKNHTNLTYRVKVVPAVADTDPYSTVTPSLPEGEVGAYGRPDVQESEVDLRWTRGETGEPPAGGGVGAETESQTPPEGATETTETPAGPETPGQTEEPPVALPEPTEQ